MMTSDDVTRIEDVREEDARRRSLRIAAAEELAADPAREDDEFQSGAPSPDADSACVDRWGHQHDHDDSAAYARTRSRRNGPGR